MLDIVLHLDAHLLALVHDYGTLVYAILFLIIFAETGLVVAPFLPGDSLLFVTGALCGMGSLELQVLMPLLMVAVDKIKDFQNKLTDFLNTRKADLLTKIRTEKAFSDALAAELKAAVTEFKQTYR